MNILFIGSTASTFSSNLAEKLNNYSSIFVDAIFSSKNKNKKKYSEKYENVFNYKFSLDCKIPKFNGIINILRLIFKLLSLKKYDIIHLHYIDSSMIYLMPILKIKSHKIVSTVWGSDFDRSSNINHFKRILNNSDLITCTSDVFKKRLEIFMDNPRKTIIALEFFHSVLNELDNMKNLSKQDVKIKVNLPIDKVIIVCGTNLRKTQHHLEIIDEIAKIEDKLLKPIFVLIQATYGEINECYLREIKEKLETYRIDYSIFSSFLNDKEMALLRKSSDILIQVQDHDQFSSAMLETLYAENLIITGSWLPYSILDQEGAVYFKVDKLSELGDVIVDCVNNYSELENMTNCNLEIVRKITQHGSVVDRWVNTYKELIN